MKRFIPIFLSLIFAGVVLAANIKVDAVKDILVDIAKKKKTVVWENKKVSTLFPKAEIKKIVLLSAETSAPGSVDAVNILKAITSDSEFIEPPTVDWTPVYQAVVIMKDETIFHVSIGRNFSMVKSENGYGIIKTPSNKPDAGDGK